jgi:hypothetical protein
MILSTHAVVGGAIASLLSAHPVIAVVAGFASHFAIDAIPHWDYPLRSIRVGRGVDNRSMIVSRGALVDLAKIGLDACVGLALAVWLFATPTTATVVWLGACAGMLPDPLQFAHSIAPYEPLKSLQRFHGWMHSRRKLTWKLGVISQFSFAIAVSAFAIMIG